MFKGHITLPNRKMSPSTLEKIRTMGKKGEREIGRHDVKYANYGLGFTAFLVLDDVCFMNWIILSLLLYLLYFK